MAELILNFKDQFDMLTDEEFKKAYRFFEISLRLNTLKGLNDGLFGNDSYLNSMMDFLSTLSSKSKNKIDYTLELTKKKCLEDWINELEEEHNKLEEDVSKIISKLYLSNTFEFVVNETVKERLQQELSKRKREEEQ